MALKINAIRGMNDIVPGQSNIWQQVENVLKSTAASFGFSEIRFPIVEKTGLFSRAIGEVTDVVEKEMYTFKDRDGDFLSLRPEGTAGCVRACLETGLVYNQEQRLWYIGPMFRHERPQKGRYRQFHQFGCEVFGLKGPDIDAEIISFTATILEKLGLKDHVRLELNSLGSSAERAQYRERLIAFLEAHQDVLDEDCKRRMYTNPLRVLDTKNPDVQAILVDAPKLSDCFGEETKAHFAGLCRLLKVLGIEYTLNDRLVRGLDYYNLTVFEWVTTDLGAQGTVCGGGRYDGLVEELGGQAVPAIGFAAGLERLILLLQELELLKPQREVDVMVCSMGEKGEEAAFEATVAIRRALPQLRVMTHCGGGKFKKQMAHADKAGALFALIVGDDEAANGTLTVKEMATGEQISCTLADTIEFLRSKAV